jgi:hypothetical protein
MYIHLLSVYIHTINKTKKFNILEIKTKKFNILEKRKTYQRQVHLRVTAYKLGLILQGLHLICIFSVA